MVGCNRNVHITECHGEFESAGKDFGDWPGSPAHFAGGKTEVQRGKGLCLTELTQRVIGSCRTDIRVSGRPAQAAPPLAEALGD